MADVLDSLLVSNDIPKNLRAVLGHIGIRRLNNLANYESSEERFREAMGKDIGLEPTDAPSRIMLSNLLECWKSSRNRLKSKDDEAATARAQGRPAPLDEDTFVSMRRGWELLHGEVDDKYFPSKYYINRRIKQLESGELKAEKMTEVSSVSEGGDDDDDRELDLVITGNSFRATRKCVTVPAPATWDTEAFRYRIQLMKRQWDVVVAQFGDKRAFVNYDREVWTRHAEYVLGESIFGYRACGLRLGWEEILTYEFELRRFALKKVNRGELSLCAAMAEAIKDSDLKQLHFTLPLTTMGKRDGAPRDQEYKRPPPDRKLEQELKKLRSEVQSLRDSASASSSSNQVLAIRNNDNPRPPKGKGKGTGKSGGKNRSDVETLKEMRKNEKLNLNLPNGGGLLCYYFNVNSCNRGRNVNSITYV